MGFKTGLLVGLGAGYVLGTRAGKERYEQIQNWWSQVSGSPTVRRTTERAKAVAGQTADRGLSVVQSGVKRAGSAVMDKLPLGGGAEG